MGKNRLRLIYQQRGLLLVPPFVFMTLCTWKEVEQDGLTFALGGVCFVAGWCLRVWSQMHLHYRLKVHKALTTTGPYAYVRNPCYVANTLLLTAVAFLSELYWFIPLMLIYCATVYSLVVRYEEDKLTKQYGILYANYCTQVARWFPKLRSLPENSCTRMRKFLRPSILAEMPNLLLVIPFLIKEAVTDH